MIEIKRQGHAANQNGRRLSAVLSAPRRAALYLTIVPFGAVLALSAALAIPVVWNLAIWGRAPARRVRLELMNECGCGNLGALAKQMGIFDFNQEYLEQPRYIGFDKPEWQSAAFSNMIEIHICERPAWVEKS